jgi:hypothetical protein
VDQSIEAGGIEETLREEIRVEEYAAGEQSRGAGSRVEHSNKEIE